MFTRTPKYQKVDVTFEFLCVSCWFKINIQQMFVYQEVQSVWNVELIFYDWKIIY